MEPTREELMQQLENAKRDLNRFMGGVDPAACVAAAQRITALRLRLRDDAALFSHFAQVASRPRRPRRRRD